MLERFKQIFSGLEIAYGQTKKTDDFSETGKHQTKSFTIKIHQQIGYGKDILTEKILL